MPASHGSPSSPARKRLCLIKAFVLATLLLTALFLLPAPHARAQGYTIIDPEFEGYSGGQVSGQVSNIPPPNTPFTLPYGFFYGTYGGGSSTYDPGSTASCSGAITTTFTWSDPNQPPPQSAIVIENCTAYALTGDGVTGSCSTGFSDPGQSSSTGGTISGTQYTGHSAPGASFTVQDTPSASSSPGLGQTGGVSVSYSASASPITIQLTGAKQDSSGNWDILIGQGCSASLAGIPNNYNYTYSTDDFTVSYQWHIGGTTFQSWSPSTPKIGTTPANPNASHYVDGPGAPDQPSPHWYWNEQETTETITCTATVTPPAGEGSPFTVTATKQVHVMVPGWTCTGTGGYMQVNYTTPNVDGAMCLHAGPNPGRRGGMDFDATVHTPNDDPAFGTGRLELVQISNPNMSETTRTVPPQQRNDPENGLVGLDSYYPSATYDEGATPFAIDDSPYSQLYNVSSLVMQHQFNDYILYQPPGTDVQWVPLATFNWSMNGSATIPTTGIWADYVKQNGSDAAGTVTPSGSPVSFTETHSYPSWTRIDVFPAF